MTAERLDCKAAFEADPAGTITGIAWPFGSADRVGDVIHPGAFKSARAPIPMLGSHDPADVVGVWDTVAETAEGLTVKGRLLVGDVTRAREMHALVKAGAIRGLSIGGRFTKAAPRKGGGRDISTVDLMEISLVAIPAHPGARVTSTKQQQEETPAVETETKAESLDLAAEITKATAPLLDRLARLEAKAARPGAPAIITKDESAAAERKAFGDYLRFGSALPAESQKSLTVSSDPQGGYFAPAEVSAEIIRNIVDVSPMRLVASVRSTGAPSVVYPKRTSVTNAAWHGELQTRTGSEPSFGQNEVVARQLSTFVDISNNLLADAPAALEEVTLALAEDFAQKEGAAFVNGDGALAPEGLWTNAAITEVATLNTALSASFDPLLAAMHALPSVVRNRGTWLMSGAALAELRKIQIAVGSAYAWNPDASTAFSATLFGRPVLELPDAPAPGNNTRPIIFGDIDRAYRIIDRAGVSILVDPFTQAVNGLTRVHATRRVGGAVINPAAVIRIRQAAS